VGINNPFCGKDTHLLLNPKFEIPTLAGGHPLGVINSKQFLYLSRWPYSGRCPDGANSLNEPIRQNPNVQNSRRIRRIVSWLFKFKILNLFRI